MNDLGKIRATVSIILLSIYFESVGHSQSPLETPSPNSVEIIIAETEDLDWGQVQAIIGETLLESGSVKRIDDWSSPDGVIIVSATPDSARFLKQSIESKFGDNLTPLVSDFVSDYRSILQPISRTYLSDEELSKLAEIQELLPGEVTAFSRSQYSFFSDKLISGQSYLQNLFDPERIKVPISSDSSGTYRVFKRTPLVGSQVEGTAKDWGGNADGVDSVLNFHQLHSTNQNLRSKFSGTIDVDGEVFRIIPVLEDGLHLTVRMPDTRSWQDDVSIEELTDGKTDTLPDTGDLFEDPDKLDTDRDICKQNLDTVLKIGWLADERSLLALGIVDWSGYTTPPELTVEFETLITAFAAHTTISKPIVETTPLEYVPHTPTAADWAYFRKHKIPPDLLDRMKNMEVDIAVWLYPVSYDHPGTCGAALNIPAEHDEALIFVDPVCFSNTKRHLVAHEIGHLFGVIHDVDCLTTVPEDSSYRHAWWESENKEGTLVSCWYDNKQVRHRTFSDPLLGRGSIDKMNAAKVVGEQLKNVSSFHLCN